MALEEAHSAIAPVPLSKGATAPSTGKSYSSPIVELGVAPDATALTYEHGQQHTQRGRGVGGLGEMASPGIVHLPCRPTQGLHLNAMGKRAP